MKRHLVTLQRKPGSVFEFISLGDIALAAFELIPLAQKVRVLDETSAYIVISYAWRTASKPSLLTDEEFGRYGLVCVPTATGRVPPGGKPRAGSESVPRKTRPRPTEVVDASAREGQRQRFVDVEAVRSFWADNVNILPNANLLNHAELCSAIAIGVEAVLRNSRPAAIQVELKACYDRMISESFASWEHVLDVAEYVYAHADLRLRADSLTGERSQRLE